MWRIASGRPIRCTRHLVAAFVIVLSCFLINLSECLEITDFLSTNVLPDGEVETRVYYEGVSAKETKVARGSRSGLRFRQLTDGHHLIQLIYASDDEVIDCEFSRDRQQTESFLFNFKQDLSDLISTSNISVESLDGRDLPPTLRWINYTELRHVCRKRHQEIKKDMKRRKVEEQHRRFPNSTSRTKRSLFILPGTLWCGDCNNAESYKQLGSLLGTDRCCRRHDHCKLGIPGLTEKYGHFNTRPFTISHCRCDKRSKRDVSDIFRVPGTKWCGKGYSAEKYTRLGGFSKTDRCCRKHDLGCPFWIGGFEEKYGLFNWRVNTLMHCNCDERFRACLKRVGTSDANLVGKLFFDIVQTKCFVLKPKKKCVRTSWWGKCEKYKMIKQAILRDNLPY